MSNQVKLFLALLIVVAIVAGAGYFIFNMDKSTHLNSLPTSDNNSVTENEQEQIKKDNQDAIEQAQTAAVKTVRDIGSNDHYQGDLSAPVQLIVYGDFDCPFSARYSGTLKQIKEHFGEKIVIAFRHFPLRSHSNALSAALASECAAEQDKFWEMHDSLFAANKAGVLSKEQYSLAAKELGLNEVGFDKCLNTEKYKDKIQTQWLEGVSFGISGTPGNFINSQPVPGSVPFEDFTDSQGISREGMKSLIEKQLAL